jgi:hypothetical protein
MIYPMRAWVLVVREVVDIWDEGGEDVDLE